MIEIRGDKKVLITPISEEDLADIKIGDIVWLDGDLMTCRDVAHRRLVEYGRELPYDIKDKAIFHAGPIVRKIEGTEDDYEMVSVGPTTSMRMEKFEYEFTKLTGVRVIVGKGGMGPNTERACKEFGAIHCVFPAGCAVVAATEVEKIVEHHWDELGMPETLWCNKVKEFGPLIVSIDAQGRNLFEENKVIFNERKEAAKQAIYPADNGSTDHMHGSSPNTPEENKRKMTGSVLDQIADVLKCGKGKGCDHGSIFDLLRFRLKYQQIKEQWQKFHHFLHHRGDLCGSCKGVRFIKCSEKGVDVCGK